MTNAGVSARADVLERRRHPEEGHLLEGREKLVQEDLVAPCEADRVRAEVGVHRGVGGVERQDDVRVEVEAGSSGCPRTSRGERW